MDGSKTQEGSTTPDPWERFRLSTQSDERSSEGHRLVGQSPYLPVLDPEPVAEKKPQRRWWAKITGFFGGLSLTAPEIGIVGVAAIGLVLIAVASVETSGATRTGVFALIALVPLALVTAILFRSDRYAPLKVRYTVIVFLWGAGAATLLASIVNTGLFDDFLGYFGNLQYANNLTAIVVAPISEELLKGTGVLLVLLIARRYVVSKKNGVMIGGLAGAGFAFTENILYFIEAESEGSAILGFTIFARGVLSPFVHPMATSFTGLAVAAAILASANAWGWIWRVSAGVGMAIILHAMWNGFASLGAWWIVLYLVVELPLFIIWLTWILTGSKKALGEIYAGLIPYVVTGWVSPAEQQMVTDRRARKYALKWARKVGRPARKSVRCYMRNAGRLGLEQRAMERMGPSASRQAVASTLVTALAESKEEYMSAGQAYAAMQGGNF